RKTWDALSAEDRAVVQKFAREAQAEERVLWTAYERQAVDKAKAAGIQIIEIADKAPFQAAVKPVWDKYGPRFADLIKRIQAGEGAWRPSSVAAWTRSTGVASSSPAPRWC